MPQGTQGTPFPGCFFYRGGPGVDKRRFDQHGHSCRSVADVQLSSRPKSRHPTERTASCALDGGPLSLSSGKIGGAWRRAGAADGAVISKERTDEIVERLRGEFIGEAEDRLATMEAALMALDAAEGDAFDAHVIRLRREAHNLKGAGDAFGFPFISLVSHRLEDYIAASALESVAARQGAGRFVDAMAAVLREGRNPEEADTASRLRELPVFRRTAATSARPVARCHEALVVSPSRTVARAVTVSLERLGLRVVRVVDPFQALATTVRARPDLVICGAVLDGLDGVDFLSALQAMEATRRVPMVLVTSFDSESAALKRLPGSVTVLRLDQTLSARLEALVHELVPGDPGDPAPSPDPAPKGQT